MRPNRRFLCVALLLMAAGLAVFWTARSRRPQLPPELPAGPAAAKTPALQLVTTPSVIAAQLASATKATNAAPPRVDAKKYRLANTDLPIGELARSDSAILLRSAFVDTASGKALDIPAHLKSGENPGSYIVQAQGAASAVFQSAVKRAGGNLVAYVPNNAFLVSATSDVAERLRREPTVRTVMPFEPYFKFDGRLIERAVEQKPLPDNTWLRITFFEGADPATLGALAQEIGQTEPSPFGPQTVVLPVPNALTELAQRPDVQMIEPWTPRVLANDLTRVRVGVSEDTLTNANWLGLTGSNIWFNLNDLGVEGTHRDLVGRVFYQGTNGSVDIDGHGTHIAGTLIGFPATNIFTAIPEDPNRTNYTGGDGIVDGSFTNASFRGLAHEAKLFVLPIAFSPGVNRATTDTYLIETAAATNYVTLARAETLISNNSWNYANATDYDSQAARFDAATRDALPGMAASQPVMYVFAAGNYGFAAEDGFGGEPGLIASPGTAKNVITVGALETPRFLQVGLTNIIEQRQQDGTTNYLTNVVKVFEATTDSDNQVAAFSSRGNVAPLVEGTYGRFKPDLVAPGTFTISAKSSKWNITNDFPQIGVSSNYYHTMTNLNGPFTEYRYDAGTSFSAPAVSGLLGLVQEFFSSKLDPALRRNLSPALMKALLINNARSVNAEYDLNPNSLINYQGWGLVDLRRVLPTNLVAQPENKWPTILIDQAATNALATGRTRTWNITLDTNAATAPLNVTLVWTDPPGNPAVAAKLVNDLDLVVEAQDGRVFHGNDILTGRVYNEARRENGAPFGNSGFRDYVNNVENVFIANPEAFGTNFAIHVIGRRVNVKAINDSYTATGDPNEVVQDFALVISSDHTLVDQAFKEVRPPAATGTFDARNLQTMTNGVPLLYQRVGANSALIVTNGVREQWNFYVFTNNAANQSSLNGAEVGKNVAFVTFTPPNLSLARAIEADIDIYVSTDARLLDLDPGAINGSWKSTTQGGTEAVVFVEDPAAVPSEIAEAYPFTGDPDDSHVFYIGIKSEDQQAAEFSLMGVSSALPFEQERNGKRILAVLPIQQFIPDGVPNRPQAGIGVAIGLSNRRILNASAYLTVSHQELGDLVGIVSHRNQSAILNNHTLFDSTFTGTNTFHFNDFFYRPAFPVLNDYAPGDPIPPEYLFTDGPGFLEEYAGFGMQGPWIIHMIDNTSSHTGRLEKMELQVDPIRDDLLPGVTAEVRNFVGATFFPVDVPPNASKMTIILKRTGGANVPLDLLVRRDLVPTTNDFDFRATVPIAPADTAILTITPTNNPPLIPGEYIIGVLNQTTTPVDFTILVLIELDESGADQVVVGEANRQLPDDVKTISLQDVTADKIVTQAAVAIVAEHARISDLALRLISPQGTRIVLAENRGEFSAAGFGSTVADVDFAGPSYAVFTDNPVAPWPIKFQMPPFGDSSTQRGPVFGFGFEGEVERTIPVGGNFGGTAWTVDTNSVAIVGSPSAYEGVNYLNLKNGSAWRAIPTVAGRSYRLSFQYRGNPAQVLGVSPAYNTGTKEDHSWQNQQAVDLHYRLLTTADPAILGANLFVASSNSPPFPAWFANDAVSQWISPSPVGDSGHPVGQYVYRTTFMLNGWSLPILSVEAAADDQITGLRLNGINVPITPTGTAGYSAPASQATPLEGLNTLDFIMAINGAPSAQGLRTRLALQGGSAPTAASVGNVSIADAGLNAVPATSTLTGTADWRLFETEFVASSANMVLRFWSAYNPGLEIDDIVLEDTGTVFMMPEEPLSTLEGERAMGEWRLEAWDNRTGAPTPARIVDWQLILSTADAPRQAEAMTRNRVYPTVINNPRIRGATNVYTPGILQRREVEWFYFDSCPNSTRATITVLTALTNNLGRVDLLMDRSGFPTGDPETDDYQIVRTVTNRTSLATTITIQNPAAAPLEAGRRMFFALRNVSIFNTNRFLVRVDHDGNCAFTPPPALTANTPFEYVTPSKDIAADGDSFKASAASATTLEVELDGAGDITVYATRSGEAGPANYEVKQRVTTTAALELPGAGEWSIRVENEAEEPAFYTLTARMDEGFDIEAVALASGKLQVTWQSVPETRYEIATSTDLINWTPITTVEATGASTTYTDSQAASGTAKFYRIQAAP